MKKYSIALAQYPIGNFESFEIWKIHIENWIVDAKSKNADLLVFPEYGSMELVSLFEPQIQQDLSRQIEKLQNILPDFIQTFSELAIKYQITLVAPSFPVKVKSQFINRAYVFGSSGLAGFQDKFFMTRFEDEIWGISSGQKTLSLFQDGNCTFGIQICYDVEFGIGSQLLAQNGANLIIAPSCTETLRGATRVHVGARARALETQCYVGVSQTILEALWSPAVDINFGYAAVYCPSDKNLPEEGIISISEPQKASTQITELDFEIIENVRNDGQVFNFKDHQKLQANFRDEEIEINKVLIQK